MVNILMKIVYVVQFTCDGEYWSDHCSYVELSEAMEGEEYAWQQFQQNTKNLKEHPEQVWPLPNVTSVRIVKRTITDEVMP